MVTTNYNQYSNARPLYGTAPAWAKGLDAERVASYQLYEEIYWNVPDAFKLVQRGTDESPIYIPSAKMVIEATNRYLGAGFTFTLSGASPADREGLQGAIDILFRREKFFSKFASFKRFGLVRGDGLWHIIGDDTKPPGRRISIHELDPKQYFPIYDPNNVEVVTGCHLVQVVKDAKGAEIVRRQTYRKDPATGRITSELGLYELTAWDDRNIEQESKPPEVKLIQLLSPAKELPEQITSLPVYHVKNNWQSGMVYGNSDLRGFERLIAAVNQGVSDEELTLALDGLGLFFTTAPRPVGGWRMGPGSVVEGDAEETMERISGVSSVAPMQDHLGYLGNSLKQGSGTPDIAIGRVEVSVAESGIALDLQMRPLLVGNSEKETELLAVLDHMFFDLTRGWFPAYEALTAGLGITVKPKFGSPMPVDRKAIIAEIIQLLGTDPPLISAEYARAMLTEKLGYQFPDDMDTDIIAAIRNMSEAAWLDPYSERIRKELDQDLATQNGGGAS